MPNLLLVTVTKDEAQAVLDVFSQASGAKWERRFLGGKTYYALGSISGTDVFMVQSEMGTAGPGGAILTIRNAIDTVTPSAVVMVGIAFGTDPKKQLLGDIVVSRQIQAYEQQKLKGERLIPRGDRVTASTRLLDKFRSGDLDWQGPRVHFGLILSGEKLIADQAFRDKLLSLETEAIGGEMEGAGLYSAASDAGTDWILVKGICDWGTEGKSDEYQRIAAENAARFTLHVIQQGGFRALRTQRVQIILDGDFEQVTSTYQRNIVAALAALLNTDASNIRVLEVKKGSIILVIEIPDTAANHLSQLVTKYDTRLIQLGVMAVKMENGVTIRLIETLEEDPAQSASINVIEKKRGQRFLYLKRLYELSGGDKLAFLSFAEIGRELGWDDATTNEVTDYLKDERLVDFPTFGTVSITHPGLKAIERALSKPNQPTDYFPATAKLQHTSISIPPKFEPQIKKADTKSTTDKIAILFLAADPSDASRLRVGEESREIQEKLQLAKQRERFELHQRMSVRPADISQALLDMKPQIVHFSGHGAATGALYFENQVGQTQPVAPDALAALFEEFAHEVNCVVLNACYSELQAKAIAEHIDYVIGMSDAIGDKAAIAFTIGFYQALGAGRSIEEAYKLGSVQIRLQGIPEHLTPVLIKKGQTALRIEVREETVASNLSPEAISNKQEGKGIQSGVVPHMREWQRRPVLQWDRRPANYEPIPLEDPTRGSSQYDGLGIPIPKPVLGQDKTPFLLYASRSNGILGIEVWPHHPTDKEPSSEITPGAQNVFSAFVLVTAGNAWRIINGVRFEKRRIGYLEFYFDAGLPKVVPLILGGNIREWSYKEIRDVGVVDRLTDPAAEQVWRSRDDQFTLDMLRIDFDNPPCNISMFRVVAECEGVPSNLKGDLPHIRVSGLTYRIDSL